MVNRKIYERLIDVARSRDVVHYKPLMDLVGLKLGNHGTDAIAKILEDISVSEHKEGRPMLTAVVTSKGEPLPGVSFFTLAKRLGRQNAESDAEFHAREVESVYRTWETKRRFWLENYWPVPGDRTFLGIWFHATKRLQPEDYAAGDRVVFYETEGNGDLVGAKALFASGIVTDRYCDVPGALRFRGKKEWTKIRIVEPEIFHNPPTRGVPLDEVVAAAPKFRGWVRQGKELSPSDFAVLEGLLRQSAASPIPDTSSGQSTSRDTKFRPFENRDVPKHVQRADHQDAEAALVARERASRAHETVRTALATFLRACGATVEDHDHVDLRSRGADEWFFEVKSCTDLNQAAQIRHGVAQLLEYRHRFGKDETRLCLALETPLRPANWDVVGYLGRLGIVLCWPSSGKFATPEPHAASATFMRS